MLLSEAYNQFIRSEILLKGGADKTRRNYETSRNSLVASIGDIPVTLLSLQHIERWVSYQQSIGNQSSSIKANLCKLRCVLKFLKKRQMNVLDYRDIELPKVKRTKHTTLDYREVQQLIDATENLRDKAIIACLFSTGCRVSELLNLNRDSIVDGFATVYSAKTAKERQVYFDKTATEALHAYLDTRHDKIPALFISGQYRRITVSRVEQIIHVATALAGIDKVVTPHVFRHSTITDYLANGAPISHVKDIAGHASIKTTSDIYGHIQPEVIKGTMRRYHSNTR